MNVDSDYTPILSYLSFLKIIANFQDSITFLVNLAQCMYQNMKSEAVNKEAGIEMQTTSSSSYNCMLSSFYQKQKDTAAANRPGSRL